MCKIFLFIVLLGASIVNVVAQQGMGTNTPSSDAVLHLVSIGQDQGLIIPQVTTAKRPTPSISIKGMMLYNITENIFQVCDGTSWITIPDNLGSHVANRNVEMSGYWVSNDGDDEGLFVDTDGNVGVGNGNPSAKFDIKNGAFLVQGTSGATPISGAGTRLMFVPAKAALRAGSVGSTQWDDANIGTGSVALGTHNVASANHTTVGGGVLNNATGVGSTIAGGSSNSALGSYTSAIGGRSNSAAGHYSTAGGGYLNTSSGDYATVSGGYNNKTTSGSATISGGSNNETGYRGTVSGGVSNRATGSGSTIAGGLSNTATGAYNFVAGYQNVVGNNYGLSIGRNNTVSSSSGVALGNNNKSTGSSSTNTIGTSNEATYTYATAIGNSNKANGQSTVALGSTNRAAAHNCIAIGNTNWAGYDRSFSFGEGDTTDARYAMALGRGLKLKCHNTVALGRFNKSKSGEDRFNWVANDPLLVVGNGTDGINRSNALMLLKNGNLGLGTDAPSQKLDVVGTIKSTNLQITTNPVAGHVLTSDINGNATWQAAVVSTPNTLDKAYDQGGAGAGRIITADNGAVLIDGGDGLEVVGVFGNGASVGTSGTGTRMFFNPKKAAFRAGHVLNTSWDDVNLGNYSTVVGGHSGVASADYSSVGGGFSNEVSGAYGNIAGGRENSTSSSYGTVSGGRENIVTANYSTIGGGFTNVVSGVHSVIAGGNTNEATAAGVTISGGYRHVASNTFATIGGGDSNRVAGEGATIPGGLGLFANTYGEVAIGTYNTSVAGNVTSWVATDRLFSIGNGVDRNNRSEALVMLKNGNTTLNGQLTLTDGVSSYNLPNTDGNSGQVLTTDGLGDVQWRDAAGGSSIKGIAVAGSTQSIPHASNTVINTYTTQETNDFGASAFDNGTFRVPAGEAGWYNIAGYVSFPTTGGKSTILTLRVNDQSIVGQRDLHSGSAGVQYCNVSTMKYLNVGDYVNLMVYQSSGSARSLASARLTAVKM